MSSKVPYVITAHTTYYGWAKHFKRNGGVVEHFIKRRMEDKMLRKAAKVIVLTDQAREDVAELGVERKNIIVSPNGVDTARFSPGRQRKDIDLLFCGRIEERKGSRSMVEICKMLLADPKARKLRIAIVGFGEDEEHVKEGLKAEIASGNLMFLGKVESSKVVGYYRRSRMYVSTSYYEGLPGTCLEAMACGLPVVVWDLHFYGNLVYDGKNGFVVKKDDYPAMKARILELLASEKKRVQLGREGRKTIEGHYSSTKVASDLVRSIKESFQ